MAAIVLLLILNAAIGVISQQGEDSGCTLGQVIGLGNNMSMIVQRGDEKMGPTIHIGPLENILMYASSPCQNDGTLLDQGYRCTCKPDYTGSTCEIDINMFASSPCQNGGSWSDKGCICTPGYTGSTCETVLPWDCTHLGSSDDLKPCSKITDCGIGKACCLFPNDNNAKACVSIQT